MKAKRNAFAALGYLAWKGAAKVGVPYAKKRLKDRDKRDVTIEVHNHPRG